jgi:hypothetical protein
MKRYLLFLGAALTLSAAASGAITIAPAEPTTLDVVSVTVSCYLPSTGYGFRINEVRIDGSEIWLAVRADPPEAGGAAVTWYEDTEVLGYLHAGTYTVYVGNYATRTDHESMTFVVRDAGPPPEPAPGTPEWFEQRKAQIQPGLDPGWMEKRRAEHVMPKLGGSLELPGFEVEDKSWSEVTSIKEGISQLDITPANPTPLDRVSVTVSGWKPGNDLVVNHADREVEGNEIRLDLHWYARPPTAVTRLQGASAAGTVSQTQDSATVTRYELTPLYEGVPYEVTESLGTFDPGAYTLYVTNSGPVSGSASTTFTVIGSDHTVDPIQDDGRPWWWAVFHCHLIHCRVFCDEGFCV